MFRFTIVFMCIAVVLHKVIGDIPESDEYGPIRRPNNPSSARDILGYDSFNPRQSKTSNTVQYGNNWEKYDTQPLPDFKYNDRYQAPFNSNNNNNNYRQPYYNDRINNQRPYFQY